MRHIRFTIASLLGLVLFVAVAVAALHRADDLWDSIVFSLTLGLLLASVLLAIHRAESRRAFWLGFALFGGAYLGASLIPPVEARLLTTRALAYLDSKVPGRDSVSPGQPRTTRTSPCTRSPSRPRRNLSSTDQGRTIRLWDAATGQPIGGPIGTSEDFLRIGHSLTALVLAFLGGHLSRSLYNTGHRAAEEERDTPPVPRSTPTGA